MWENGKGSPWRQNSNLVCLLLVFLNIYITYANPQDEFFSPDEDEGTTIHPLTAAPPECERYPEKNALFSSDNFPSKYNKNSRCLYHMVASPGKRVHLTFFLFDTEVNSRCTYDKVEVYDSNGSRIHKFCGQNSNNVNVVSSEETLFFNFTTDKVQEKQGFLASWQEVDQNFELETKEENGKYYLSYPTAFIEDSPEKVCVELFEKLNSDVTVSTKVYAYDDRNHEEETGEKDVKWTFDQKPIIQEEIRISSSEAVKCFDLTIPETNLASKGLVNFELKSEDSTFHVNKFQSISIYQKEKYPLIQTDKGQYKAGDIVKFRVLVLDHELKPAEVKEADEIWISDPKNRRIVQWKKKDLVMGMLQLEFTLSEEPELGEWKIHFMAGPVSSKAGFKVSEYVLPKFEVIIKPPSAVLRDSVKVDYEVCGVYTHGGSVKGSIIATFSSSRVIRSWPKRQEDIRTVEVEAEVGDDEECAVLTLTREQLTELTEHVNNLKLNAVIRERGTDTTEEAEWTGVLEDKAIKLEVKEGSEKFTVGGFPYTGQFSVMDHDGSPREEEISVCVALYRDVQNIRQIFNRRGIWSMDEEEIVTVGRQMEELEHSRRCHTLRSTEGKIQFYVPMDNIPQDVVKLSIKAIAVNHPSNETTKMVQPTAKLSVDLSHVSAELTLSLKDKQRSSVSCDALFKPRVYFSATRNQQFDLHYQALSKGVIFKSGNFKVTVEDKNDALDGLIGGGQNHVLSSQETPDVSLGDKVVSYQELELAVDYSVSPSLKLIVFVNTDNFTLGDSHTYEVESCQRHKVAAKFSEEKVYPGSPVSLSVSAQPGSLCGLSATDKSVDLLGNGNKITQDTVAKLQAEIGDRKTSRSENYWEYQRKCPKSYEVFKVFENSGVAVITDLPIIRACQLITDAVNITEEDPVYEVAHAVPTADQFDLVEDANFNAPVPLASVAADGPTLLSGALPSLESEEEVKKPVIELRNYFPENWLFSLENMTDTINTRDLEAPHTLTTWLGEAFCLHPEAGLGVAAPDTLLVSQDFFAEISLPYSVKRGEVFPLNISVFNYVDQELPIRVELLVNDADIAAAKKSVDMCVLPKNNQVVTLMVSSLILGEVNITSKATIRNDIEGCQTVATGEGFSDTLVKPLRVKPEGVPVEIVQSEFKCMDPTDSEALQFPNNFELDNLELPDNVVEGSERAWVHVTGDVMAPALENVGSLVSLPTGCGEQNMVGLVPNIYLLDYLAAVGKDENMPEIVKKAKNYMNIGYKRQQNYRHPDGAYSIWGGKGDKDGSTWLTAFVVKAFSEASNFISVDSSLVQASVNWLLKGQMENGCFTKRGYVHSSYLKGGLSDDSLTAFVLTALHTASKNMKTVEVDPEKLSAAYSCMMASVNTSDLYTTIVAAHAANLWWGGEQVQEVARLMEAIESRADTSSGLKFWETEKEEVECESRCWWYYRPTSEAVEMTAYNVMSYVLRDQLPMALEPVKWLAKQRNSKGGFVSTQDTVVALQALSLYSQQVTRIPLSMEVDISEGGAKVASVALNEDTALLLRTQQLTRLPAQLEVSGSGGGCAMVQSVLRYNTRHAEADRGFAVSASPQNVNSVEESPSLLVCTSYIGNREKTGMVLVEVELVTGWEADRPEDLVKVEEYSVQRVEHHKEDNKVVLYFDEITRAEECVALPLRDVMTIEEAKDALVTVYDYYNREETASLLYNMDQ